MEKTKKKFNLVDLIVVIAIVSVVAFAAVKLVPGSIFVEDVEKEDPEEKTKYEITFYTEESTDYSLVRIDEGDPVCDESNNIIMGEVTEKPVLKESEATVVTYDGKNVKAPREGYSSTYITFVGEGLKYKHGAKFKAGLYSVGQTITLRVGDSKVYGRIYDIKAVD